MDKSRQHLPLLIISTTIKAGNYYAQDIGVTNYKVVSTASGNKAFDRIREEEYRNVVITPAVMANQLNMFNYFGRVQGLAIDQILKNPTYFG